MVANSSGSFLRCSNFLPEDEEAALGPLGPLRQGDRGRGGGGNSFPEGRGPTAAKKKKGGARDVHFFFFPRFFFYGIL